MAADPEEPVPVKAYAGARGEEEPRSFEHAGRRLEVREVLDRWREPRGRGFRVLASDGRRHLLLCTEPAMTWYRIGEGPPPGSAPPSRSSPAQP